MHRSLLKTDHRPWPVPLGTWRWRQSWLDLAFLHFPVACEETEKKLPKGVALDTFNDAAWIGLVPFMMAGVMRRPFPDLPFFSSFPELNLRTSVIVDGKPGVWFFSLDADSHPVVFGGRRFYNVPSYYAKCSLGQRDRAYTFQSQRRRGEVGFEANYQPADEAFFAEVGSFEHWATERYCLYSMSGRGALQRVEVHHEPWPLQYAEVRVTRNDVITASNLSVLREEPVCHFSRGVDVVSYGVEACADSMA